MAETKTKKAKPKARASNRSKARSGSKAKKAPSKAAPSKPQAVLDAVEETAKDAGGKVGRAASKAKVPLLAGGAAIAGAAGGLALGRQAHHHKSHKSGLAGVRSKDLAKAARKAGDVGAQVGEIALEMRRAREATNGHGKDHRSPIEVVLQGLTSRR